MNQSLGPTEIINPLKHEKKIDELITEESFLNGKSYKVRKAPPVPQSKEGILTLVEGGYWRDISQFKLDGEDAKFATIVANFRIKNFSMISIDKSETFTMTVFEAMLLHHKGNTAGCLDMLYILLKDAQGFRRDRLVFLIVDCHLILKQNSLALQLLESMDSKDVFLLSIKGLIYLNSGNLNKCKEIFGIVDEIDSNSVRAHLNHGYLYFSQGMLTSAVESFQIALKLDPVNRVAANQAALCHFYLKNIHKAIGILEDLIKIDPETCLDESIAFNLNMLYNLENNATKRKILKSIISKVKHDDF
jgi:tetratricopeptide (TPR) repeat protein